VKHEHKPCCQVKATPDAAPQPLPQPPAHPIKCKCCPEQPTATAPEADAIAAASWLELAGDLIPAAFLGLTAVPPEHLGLPGRFHPPERAGVDSRFEALFSRHVLRC
jgi:hypothetical protein